MLLLNKTDTEKYFLSCMQNIQAPACVLFKAEMGSGKTHLIKVYLNSMGIKHVSSPTFALHNSYNFSDKIFDHLDLHRLENLDELESTGFWDLFSDKNNIVLIEWAENLQGLLPPKTYKLYSVDISLSPLHGPEARQVIFQQLS